MLRVILFFCAAIASICTSLLAQTPAARPKFEVASVKLTANEEAGGGRFLSAREMLRDARPPGMIPMDDPGRVRLEDWALLDLIAAAYSVRTAQVSGPAWLSSRGFDIEAKVPESTRKEELNAMLQSLLEERFDLKVHRSAQTRQGFALVVGKNGPKLKPAEPPLDPEQRIADGQRRMRERESDAPMVGFTRMSARSVTTEALAARLVRFAEAPVVDETSLTGKYSVTIETWKNSDVPGGTIFEAVEKLGLKLEPRKLTVETVVVDQVLKTPTAN
jgi:uncharacterized protein (TIGR03435 family)